MKNVSFWDVEQCVPCKNYVSKKSVAFIFRLEKNTREKSVRRLLIINKRLTIFSLSYFFYTEDEGDICDIFNSKRAQKTVYKYSEGNLL
jgi:hypothetical protein